MGIYFFIVISGFIGYVFAENDTTIDPTGPPCLPGMDGRPGERGRDGLPGDDGRRGEKGEKGERGLNGLDGLPGWKGEMGDYGDPGLPGRNGFKGDTGIPGETGAPGIPGRKGDSMYCDCFPQEKHSMRVETIFSCYQTSTKWLPIGFDTVDTSHEGGEMRVSSGSFNVAESGIYVVYLNIIPGEAISISDGDVTNDMKETDHDEEENPLFKFPYVRLTKQNIQMKRDILLQTDNSTRTTIIEGLNPRDTIKLWVRCQESNPFLKFKIALGYNEIARPKHNAGMWSRK